MDIILCDDQTLVRDGIRRILEAEHDIRVVAEVETANEAIEAAREITCDVLLTEVDLPGRDGFEVVREIQRFSSGGRPVVALIARLPSQAVMLEGLRSGAHGFLVKSDSAAEIVAGIRSLAAGLRTFSASVDDLLRPRTQPSAVTLAPTAADLAELTGREIEVLRCIARGMNNNEIASALTVSQATVKSHVSRLLTKLHLRDRAQAIVVAFRAGLVPIEAPMVGVDTAVTGGGTTLRLA